MPFCGGVSSTAQTAGLQSRTWEFESLRPRQFNFRTMLFSMNPKAIGEVSEGCILAAFLKAGAVVLQPFGNNQRYDFAVDVGQRFVRIQCKTGRLRNGVIKFASCSLAGGRTHRCYHGEADFFAVYCPELDSVYLIPVEDAGRRGVWLRVNKARSNQTKNIRIADQYIFRSVAQLEERRPHKAEAAGS